MKTNTFANQSLLALLAAAVVIAAAGVLLLSVPSAHADNDNSFEDDVENPQSGSLGLAGVVEGEPPESPAAINSPVAGETITDTPITVSGTCEPELVVELFKNDSFSGSAVCDENGTFEIETSLFRGENELLLGVRDLLGQSGPESDTVTVEYDPQVTGTDREIGPELILTSPISFRGAAPGSEISFPLDLSGGSGPYAISINWGNGDSDVVSRDDTGSFDISHTYDNPGIYRIVIQATDDNERFTFLQLTAVIDGEVRGELTEEDTEPARVETSYILWPMYVLAALVPVAFWLGMRHMKRKYE